MNELPSPAATRDSAAAGRIRRRIGAHDARDRRQRRIVWALLVAIGVLLVNSLVGENGYLATLRAKQEEAVLLSAVARVRIENQRLKAERALLETDPEAVKDAARRELGVIYPGETVFIVQDAPAVPPAAPVR
jgi:cell division protein FtsB